MVSCTSSDTPGKAYVMFKPERLTVPVAVNPAVFNLLIVFTTVINWRHGLGHTQKGQVNRHLGGSGTHHINFGAFESRLRKFSELENLSARKCSLNRSIPVTTLPVPTTTPTLEASGELIGDIPVIVANFPEGFEKLEMIGFQQIGMKRPNV